ncbi:flagellar type III secretion system pore protein FliP [Nocardioides sp. GY 10127]|uniref:flagellar type III secretion system pore protein FliP n=1 Tax=Nocardioides sp. GY 10127 TaxID=2569762 RepID=UPI0010A83D0C|nr:flagellar type III secretion system pore protein FliP [Nocardioides sp. GY 10127]TIC78641.1 flagellar type III secretion system pore protein FliP [Nocardioides sp. GY 10127]
MTLPHEGAGTAGAPPALPSTGPSTAPSASVRPVGRHRAERPRRPLVRAVVLGLAALAALALILLPGAFLDSASASGTNGPEFNWGSGTMTGPSVPGSGSLDPTGDGSVSVDVTGLTRKPSESVALFIALTLLSLAPAIVLTCTSFTKILVVLGLTRNALGLQQTPPNQVLAGLALFLSLFIMAPVLSQMNDAGVQPYMDGTLTAQQSWDAGIEPLRSFMLDNTEDEELATLTRVAGRELPSDRADVPLTTLIPAYVLSELKDAFIIGFIIFIPFLVIDLVVSGALMALGMMMMPPVMVSLPFKLLLFVLVDGWALIITALVQSYA